MRKSVLPMNYISTSSHGGSRQCPSSEGSPLKKEIRSFNDSWELAAVCIRRRYVVRCSKWKRFYLYQNFIPMRFSSQRVGRSPSLPVSRRWYALLRSRTTVSMLVIDSWTLSMRSGLGNNLYWWSASCSMVSSTFFSFSKTYHSLCRSELDLMRSSSSRQLRPHRTSDWPQCFLSSKNSIKS